MPVSLLYLALVEHLVLVFSIYNALFLRWADASNLRISLQTHLPEAITFATVFSVMMFSVGLYNKEYCRRLGIVFSRLVFSFLFGFTALSLVFYVYPELAIWRSAFAIAFFLGLFGILMVRWIFLHVVDLEALKRRIMVLGTGEKAARIAALEDDSLHHGFICVGFVPLGGGQVSVDSGRILGGNNRSMAELANEHEAEEIVVALDERRGTMPMENLLACKFAGISITEYTTFWERETGRVDLDSLYPSWLVYSDGFPGGWLQALLKRAFDIAASLAILVLTLPIFIIVAIAIKLESRGPVLYRQERLGLHGHPFVMFKFRSMRTDAERDGVPRWAAVEDDRITAVGSVIRKTRMDELPQVFNIISGQMSFIGPRPERPFFVEKLREAIPLYLERHRVKPGLSGWAQLNYPYGASVEDARHKFEYDLYYIKNYSLFLDLIVLVQTVRVVLWPSGVR